MPNPTDVGTIRLLEQAGFEALATSTAGFAFTLGHRDGAVSREQMMEHVRHIATASRLPVSADLGDGFGKNPETVAETIRLAFEAGAVGESIEDCLSDDPSSLLEIGLARARIEAAVAAARTLPVPFTITARAENFIVGKPDLRDALSRLAAYRDAGADVLYAPCIADEDALVAVIDVAEGRPVNVLALGHGVSSDVERLRDLGVKRISLGSALTRAALSAVSKCIRQIRRGDMSFLSRTMSLSNANEMFSPAALSRTGLG